MLPRFSVKQPYTVIVSVVLVLILGAVSFTNMTTDLLPNIELPYAIVMTNYEGATPEQVETVVSKPVEQSMATIGNIKSVSSMSNEGTSVVILEFNNDVNMDSVTIDMRESLDMIKSYWPEGVSSPIILKLNPNMLPVMVASIDAKQMSITELSKYVNDTLLPEFESIDGIASVSTTGLIEDELNVVVKGDKIAALNKQLQEAVLEEFSTAEGQINSASSQIKNGQEQIIVQEAKMQTTLSAAETAITNGKIELAKKEAELQTLETTIQTTKTQIDNTLAAIESNEDLTPEQKAAAIAAANASIAELTKQEKELAAGKSALEKAKAELNEKSSELTKNKVDAQSKLNAAKNQLSSGSAPLESARQQLEQGKAAALGSFDLETILTEETISGMLSAQNFSMPAGYVTEKGTKYMVRVGDEITSTKALGNLVLFDLTAYDLGKIRLKDVADVAVINNESTTYNKVNGNNAVFFTMQKQTNYSTADVARRVRERMAQITKENPDLHMVPLMDQGIYVDMVVDSVLSNLMMGGVLAIVILLIFLRSLKPTIVIAFSIPISVVFALALMYFSGVTLNIISLSGLALGVGMLVDNSIVVIENIFRLRTEGASVKKAAIEGAKQVTGAITASTLTTICVFLPIVFVQGISRQLFTDIGLTIAYSLVASLLVALTLVPMMASRLLTNEYEQEEKSKWFHKLLSVYEKLLEKSLKHKFTVLAGSIILLAASAYFSFQKGTAFMPKMDSTQISVNISMPKGSKFKQTTAMCDQVIQLISSINDVDNVGVMMSNGSDNSGGLMALAGGGADEDSANVYVLLKEKKKQSSAQIAKKIEDLTSDLDCTIEVSDSSMDVTALGGAGISIKIKGSDLDKLQEISQDMIKLLKDIKGTGTVYRSGGDAAQEMRVTIDKAKAIKYNLTVAQIYAEISEFISGSSNSTTLTTDDAEYPVMIMDSSKEGVSGTDLKNYTFTVTENQNEKKVKLSELATIHEETGFSTINRENQIRYLNVHADLADGYNIGIVSNEVASKLENYNAPSGYTVAVEGESETINDAMKDLLMMLVLAIIFIYLIMVAQFQSLLSPFIVMFTLPLAFTGGFMALVLTDNEISVISLIGFVLLTGIVVNNGIVFVDFTNQLMATGMGKKEALIKAGMTRLRPILMTALTTILGLSTMTIGMGMGVDMVQPMAIVTSGGLIYATLMTLFIVPIIYDLFHRKEYWDIEEEL